MMPQLNNGVRKRFLKMGSDRRRHTRYLINMPAQLVVGRYTIAVTTIDVSFGGIFVQFNHPDTFLPLRQLGHLQITLPPNEIPLDCHVMTVHTFTRNNEFSVDPGVGLQLFAMDAETDGCWNRFVQYVQLHSTDAPRRSRPPATSPELPRRREFKRSIGRLELRLRTFDDLTQVFTRDVSAGGMFIKAKLALEIGQEITVDVVHPYTQEKFPLAAVVRWCNTHSGESGFGVEFTDVDDTKRYEFLEFIESKIIFFDDEALEVDEEAFAQVELLSIISTLPGTPQRAPQRASIVEIGVTGIRLEASMPIDNTSILLRFVLPGDLHPLELRCDGKEMLDEDLLKYAFDFVDHEGEALGRIRDFVRKRQVG